MFRGDPGGLAKKQAETNEEYILKRHNYTRFKNGEFAFLLSAFCNVYIVG